MDLINHGQDGFSRVSESDLSTAGRLYQCIGLTLLFVILLIVGCARQAPVQRSCPVEELLLNQVVSSSELTTAGEIMSPLPESPSIPLVFGRRSAIASAGRTFYAPEGIANHDVYQYHDATEAAVAFQRNKKIVKAYDGTRGAWPENLELRVSNSLINQQYTACGYYLETSMCMSLLQYEEYYIYFQAHVEPEGWLPLEEYQLSLDHITNEMERCLTAESMPKDP